ncbi:hypothetical protein CHU98_g763 [Xylaria longipes]|nr:hypothetical protein CHU98_g763 [Xylaria longipes]
MQDAAAVRRRLLTGRSGCCLTLKRECVLPASTERGTDEDSSQDRIPRGIPVCIESARKQDSRQPTAGSSKVNGHGYYISLDVIIV